MTPKGAWLKAGGLLKVGMTRKKNWEWRIENLGITANRRLLLSTAGKAFHIKPPPQRGFAGGRLEYDATGGERRRLPSFQRSVNFGRS